VVNGVLLTDVNNANPRIDKQYPFTKFGYAPINEGRFFYYRSLAFALQQDANVINTLYPLYVDGAILAYNPPLQNLGGEVVSSSDVVPGAVINFTDKGANLTPVIPAKDQSNIINAVAMVEDSIMDTAVPATLEQGSTATQSLLQKQQSSTVLDLFMRMIGDMVVKYGQLRVSDILQHLTVANGLDTSGKTLMYQSFILGNKNGDGKSKTIRFDGTMPDEMSELEELYESYKVFIEEKDTELIKVNPKLFRSFTYECKVYPDSLAPTSSELERAYVQELYALLANNPIVNQEELVRLILQSSPTTKKNPDKFIAPPAPPAPVMPTPMTPEIPQGGPYSTSQQLPV